MPLEGDVVQQFEVRLIQSLLMAFDDPDAYFCSWWALGVWLGSPSRKLPLTPAVFDRKTKWRFPEMTEDERSDWQHDYSSISGRAELVLKQLKEEEAESLIIRMRLREAML